VRALPGALLGDDDTVARNFSELIGNWIANKGSSGALMKSLISYFVVRSCLHSRAFLPALRRSEAREIPARDPHSEWQPVNPILAAAMTIIGPANMAIEDTTIQVRSMQGPLRSCSSRITHNPARQEGRRRANMRGSAILPALLVGVTLALSVTPAAAWWQFVFNGPAGERQISPHFKTEKECNSVLKVTEADLAKKYPNRYPLVGSCEEYR
jgi:hypothetical protein